MYYVYIPKPVQSIAYKDHIPWQPAIFVIKSEKIHLSI